MLKPGSVRRIAIGVQPGFRQQRVRQRFYPPQSIQPFAVLDSLIRLGLADARTFQLYTFDISPA